MIKNDSIPSLIMNQGFSQGLVPFGFFNFEYDLKKEY